MKKIAFLSALALTVGFTSCDNYKEPNPPAQSNPQESVLKTDEVAVKSDAEGVYNLAELNTAGSKIQVATIECTTLPSTYEFVGNVEISANGFASAYTVPSTVEKTEEGVYAVTVSPNDLEGVYQQNISKDPAQKEIQYRVNLATQIGNQIAYVGGQDNYYGPYALTLIPYTPGYVVESSYYLVSSADDWNLGKAIELKNSGASPYDDPVFSAAIDITPAQAAAGYAWKIVPASTKAAGTMDGNVNYGVSADLASELEGKLVQGGANGIIADANPYLVTVNMQDLTYSISVAVPYLYTPGDANGWSQTASQMLYTNDFANYYGYAVLATGGFKFTNAPDWDHTNYGNAGEAGLLSTDPGAGNLSVDSTGLYWCHVNTPALTYGVTLIETIGVIGDATPAGWDASTALSHSEDYLYWSGDIKFGNGEFKFRANDGWDINLGGNLQDLVQDGANLASPGEGTYHVVLNLSQLPYSVELTKVD